MQIVGLTLDQIRAATCAQHQDLEDRLDIFGRIATLQGRRDLVVGFHRLHHGLETAVEPWIADLPGLEFEARRRTNRLVADLASLGVVETKTGVPPPTLGSVGAALGAMYVLEGSALGGRVIQKRASTGDADLTGLSFLDPYGAALGERWRSFLGILERETATPQARQDAMAGATAGFRYAAACLSHAVLEAR